jgi:carboxyl-terminal processing protease
MRQAKRDKSMIRLQGMRVLAVLPLVMGLASCGGGGGGGGGGAGTTLPPRTGWTSGVFQPSSGFADRCAAPRAGTSDRTGSALDERNWLRSWSNELYLWYGEIQDRDPAATSNTLDYFDLLKTNALTPSGQPKDKFHFTYPSDVWLQLSQGGVQAGYGVEFAVLAPAPPRRIVVAYTEPGSPGATQFARGDEILTVDGVDAVNGGTQANVDTLNGGLFPDGVGESHVFTVRNVAGVTRSVTISSATVTRVPVPTVTTFDGGTVGYIAFHDHISTAEHPLVGAINTLRTANAGQPVSDLILDLRYNGGGYLDMASELAYMIGNTTMTAGRTFERIVFNDKNPSRNPVTGETLTPTPFHTRAQNFPVPAGSPQLTPNQLLPTLNLGRVYIITGPGTCSASESIINGLRGVGIDVYVIGSTTCGKPYGFYPTDNCGTTYFTIQFRGENAANFGDYADGFSPANQPVSTRGTSVPGCSVADDYTRALGDPLEGRIAAARAFRASGNMTCPTASGFTDPRINKAQLYSQEERALWVSKPAARQNRLMRN